MPGAKDLTVLCVYCVACAFRTKTYFSQNVDWESEKRFGVVGKNANKADRLHYSCVISSVCNWIKASDSTRPSSLHLVVRMCSEKVQAYIPRHAAINV